MIIRIQKRNLIERIVYWECIMVPIFQIINSFLLFEDNESDLGKLFRIISLIVAVAISYKHWNKKQLYILLLLLAVVMSTVLFSLITGSEISIMEWIVSIMKLISPLIYTFSFISIFTQYNISDNLVDSILSSLSWIVSMCLIIPYIFGIGNYKYDGTGYNGLFYENDELNIVLCCLLLFSIHQAFCKPKLSIALRTVIVAVALLITGSKVSIVYTCVIILYVLYFVGKRSLNRFVKNTIILSSLVSVIVILYNTILNQWVNDKLAYYFAKYMWQSRNGSFLAFFTNERTDKLRYYFSNYVDIKDASDVLFGVARKYGNYFMVEMDFFDLFFKFGLPTTIFVIVICFLVFIKCCKTKGLGEYKFALLLMLLYSFFAGHLYESFFMGVIIGLYITVLYIGNKE